MLFKAYSAHLAVFQVLAVVTHHKELGVRETRGYIGVFFDAIIMLEFVSSVAYTVQAIH